MNNFDKELKDEIKSIKMCGICATLLNKNEQNASQTQQVQKSLLHRGPDYFGTWSVKNKNGVSSISHTRLAIVDPTGGKQPIVDTVENVCMAANGEIYNHASLRDPKVKYQTNSDCEVILRMYLKNKNYKDWINKLRGMFSFVIVDNSDNNETRFLIGRDPFGIIPLYYGRDKYGALWIVSEMKAFPYQMETIDVFPPGHIMTQDTYFPVKYYKYVSLSKVPSSMYSDPSIMYNMLDDAVKSHMMSDVPFGVLLSGGLDSSIIAALICKHSAKRIESGESEDSWYPRVHSFSIGLKNSPDLACARIVAKHIGSIHHEFTFTIDEALKAIPQVIRYIETYDTTTVRASTPMFLLAEKIRMMGIKMVLSGEGADEIFGGYLYFRKAPDATQFHEECVRKVTKLHQYDCLRANKSMMAHSVECRTPFLDTPFVEYAMRLDPSLKMCPKGTIEKKILRDTFGHLLPPSIANRQKEQFSDGVGYNWIDSIKKHCDKKYGEQWRDISKLYHTNRPRSAEELWYRKLFQAFYPADMHACTVPWGESIACSTPAAIKWDASFKNNTDPSGRSVDHHKIAYSKVLD